jgi:Reverse transcriptase (RNA-dependent DNA polymerase)/RNase H-like domain found in reverse transcriptase
VSPGVSEVKPGRLFFIFDSVSNKKLLVDTGSSFSLFPFRSTAKPSGPRLKAANGQRIRCWGSRQRCLLIGGKSFQWQFLQAEVSFPILGVDFLRGFQLLVDVVGSRLIPRSAVAADGGGEVFTVLQRSALQRPAAAAPAISSATAGSTEAPLKAVGSSKSYAKAVKGGSNAAEPRHEAAAVTAAGEWHRLVAEFPGVTLPFTVASSPTHGVQHHIETSGRPVTAKFRRLDPARLAAAKAEFGKMLAAGVVRRSSSCWSSPLHMVKKKDGSWQPCGDFRRLNLATTEDKYPLPNMADLSSRLEGCKVFSKLDLQKGYLQVPVRSEDIPKTAIITPFGLFEFTRMPFGLRNAGMTFQRMMDQIFFDLPCVFVYLDDLLVASRSVVEHREHLRQVLQLLQANGLVINLEKCTFGQPRLEFLGHAVHADGVSPLQDRVAAVKEFPKPTTVVEMQAFLGLYNYYRRFVPAEARLLKPLTDALQGGLRPNSKLVWSSDMDTAFAAAKLAISAATLLDHPSPAAELMLVTDASGTHVGAVLQQRRGRQAWRALGFFSQKLSDT